MGTLRHRAALPIGRRLTRRGAILAGASVLAAAFGSAAQTGGPRRIGVFLFFKEGDSEASAYVEALQRQLGELGWRPGTDLVMEFRYTDGDPELVRRYSKELVTLEPAVILAAGGSHVGPLQRLTRTVPIVFVQVTDALGGGFVESMARPGGNVTGVTLFSYDMSGKWLELLTQVAPRTRRIAVLRDTQNPSGAGQFAVIQSMARSSDLTVVPIGLHSAEEIEQGIREFAQKPNGGLVVTPSGLAINHRALIIRLAAQHSLPAIYPFRHFAYDGGLISYGPDVADQYRQAATYIDRILRGEKPAELPVRQASKVEMIVNVATAKALGIAIPPLLLSSADETIER